jgi:dTDP-4-dehydrorhamnose 3,5-epimerase
MIKVENTKLEGVKLISLEHFEDHRGEYVETYNEREYFEAGIPVRFIQDDYSVSSRHVLRGLHGDSKTWKLVSCPYGKFYLVVVNCNTESPDFGKWQAFVLSDKNKHQVLIPPMYGNGHLILSEMATFNYKQSEYYDPSTQFSYVWNDPKFNIWWPIDKPHLSQRDQLGRYV